MPSTKKLMVAVMMVFVSVLLFSQLNNKLVKLNNPRDPKEMQNVGGSRLDLDTEKRALRVEVSMPRLSFLSLQKLNETFKERYGIQVELINHEEANGRLTIEDQFRLGQPPDVLLVHSESVQRLAQKGWLLPYESAINNLETVPFWMKEDVRWNGLTWGVPAYVDPYVLVWNKKTLSSFTHNDAPPATNTEWMNLMTTWFTAQSLEEAAGGQAEGQMASTRQPEFLFSWQEEDPSALLSFMWRIGFIQPNLPGERLGEPDLSSWRPPVVTNSSRIITSTAGSSLSSPSQEKESDSGNENSPYQWLEAFVQVEEYDSAFHSMQDVQWQHVWDALEQGKAMFAMVPYSEAMQGMKEPFSYEEQREVKYPYGTFVRGSSYVISADSALEEEAKTWISFMTEHEQLQEMWDMVSLLPADGRVLELQETIQRRYLSEVYLNRNEEVLALRLRTEQLLQFGKQLGRWLQNGVTTESLLKQWDELWLMQPSEHDKEQEKAKEPVSPQV